MFVPRDHHSTVRGSSYCVVFLKLFVSSRIVLRVGYFVECSAPLVCLRRKRRRKGEKWRGLVATPLYLLQLQTAVLTNRVGYTPRFAQRQFRAASEDARTPVAYFGG